jgi:hypothetical protein
MDRDLKETIGLAPTAAMAGQAGARLRVWGLVTLGTSLCVITVSLAVHAAVDVVALAALSAALIAAEHRDRLFGDGTSISVSLVVSLASVVVFSPTQWLAGPMICAAVAGLYWPHIRTRALSRIAINAGSMSLAAGAAAWAFRAGAPALHSIDIRFVLAGLFALAAFWIVNSMVLAVAVATIQQRSWLSVTYDLIRSDTALLPFAVGGLACGYLIHATAAWIGWPALIATLAVADLIVIRNGLRRVTRHGAAGAILIAAVSLCCAAALFGPGVGAALLVPTGFAVLGVTFSRGRVGGSHLFGLVCVVAAVLYFGTGAALVSALAVGLAISVADLVRTRANPQFALASADALAAMAVGLVGSVAGDALSGSSPSLLLAVGVACALAALIGWHVGMGMELAARLGRDAWRPVLDVIRTDLAPFAIAGVVGWLCSWAGRSGGFVWLATSLGALFLVLAAVAARSPRSHVASSLDDITVLEDVVQSALLDLPASKVPSDL